MVAESAGKAGSSSDTTRGRVCEEPGESRLSSVFISFQNNQCLFGYQPIASKHISVASGHAGWNSMAHSCATSRVANTLALATPAPLNSGIADSCWIEFVVQRADGQRIVSSRGIHRPPWATALRDQEVFPTLALMEIFALADESLVQGRTKERAPRQRTRSAAADNNRTLSEKEFSLAGRSAQIKDRWAASLDSIVMPSEDVYTDAINTLTRDRSGSCNFWLSDVGCS